MGDFKSSKEIDLFFSVNDSVLQITASGISNELFRLILISSDESPIIFI